MKAHFNYFKYVIRHKWFVFLAGLKLGVPLLALITHDWSKFLPSEWAPYVAYFDKYEGRERPLAVQHAFDVAWNYHQKRQPHHWNYWCLITDSDEPRFRPLPMPERYLREMVADWHGAGRALGKNDTVGWYLANCEKIVLHPDTRRRVENLLRIPYTNLVEQEQRA
jgi:hypothetical protein